MRIAVSSDERTASPTPWSPSCASAATSRCCTARCPRSSATTGPGPPSPRPARPTSPRAAPSRGSSAAGRAPAPPSRPAKVRGVRAPCAATPDRRGRAEGTTPTCSRSPCARPPRPCSPRSSTPGSRPRPRPTTTTGELGGRGDVVGARALRLVTPFPLGGAPPRRRRPQQQHRDWDARRAVVGLARAEVGEVTSTTTASPPPRLARHAAAPRARPDRRRIPYPSHLPRPTATRRPPSPCSLFRTPGRGSLLSPTSLFVARGRPLSPRHPPVRFVSLVPWALRPVVSWSPGAPELGRRRCLRPPPRPSASPAPRTRRRVPGTPLVLEVELALDPVHDLVGDLALVAQLDDRRRCASSTERTIFWYLRERCS